MNKGDYTMTATDILYKIAPEDEAAIEGALNSEYEIAENELQYPPLTSNQLPILANRLLWYQAKARALEAEYRPIIEAMEADLAFLEKRIARLQSFIGLVFSPGRDSDYVDDNISLFYKATESVQIENAERITIDFMRLKTEPDIKKIAEALKQGQEVSGAKLSEHYHLQIKPGGEKARANQKKRIQARNKNLSQSTIVENACATDNLDIVLTD